MNDNSQPQPGTKLVVHLGDERHAATVLRVTPVGRRIWFAFDNGQRPGRPIPGTSDRGHLANRRGTGEYFFGRTGRIVLEHACCNSANEELAAEP
jgi:hypothetical protein